MVLKSLKKLNEKLKFIYWKKSFSASEECFTECFTMPSFNARITVGHLNINSIRNKFIFVESIVKAFDLFLISESKLDSTFPMNQFHIFGFKVFRLDHNRFGGGLILYINERFHAGL